MNVIVMLISYTVSEGKTIEVFPTGFVSLKIVVRCEKAILITIVAGHF